MRKLILLFAIVFAMVFSFGCSKEEVTTPAETEPTVIIEETTIPEDTTPEEEEIEETTEPPVEETTNPPSSSSNNKKPSTTKPTTPKDETPTTTVPPETTVPETTVPQEPEATEPETTTPPATEPEEESNLVYLGRYKLTAYCNCSKCCGKWADGFTATGTMPKEGRTIAVDPKVIPYGSKVVINGHTYVAEDCGGAIKGNRIDVFFASHSDANKFGVQYADVYLKK